MQVLVIETLQVYLNIFCNAYLNDIIIYSELLKEHQKHIHLVLEALQKINLFIKLEKCQFYQEQMKFLRFLVSKDDIKMNSAKIDLIMF